MLSRFLVYGNQGNPNNDGNLRNPFNHGNHGFDFVGCYLVSSKNTSHKIENL